MIINRGVWNKGRLRPSNFREDDILLIDAACLTYIVLLLVPSIEVVLLIMTVHVVLGGHMNILYHTFTGLIIHQHVILLVVKLSYSRNMLLLLINVV